MPPADNRSTRSDHGQVLVIFAAGLLAMCAIAALVIDLGFVFVARRQAQNVADPAAVVAARYIGLGGTRAQMEAAACDVAHQNGLFGGQGSTAVCTNPANDPQGTSMAVNYPPSAAGGTFAGRPGFVEVVISRNQGTFLSGVVGIKSIRVTSSAVAAFSQGDSNSNSIIALDPTSCSSLKTHGTGDITVHPVVAGTAGGYVQVNSTCSNGAPDTMCGSGGGSAALDTTGGSGFTAPHIYVAGTCKANSPLGGPLTEGSVQIGDPLSELAPPDPADYPAGRCGPGQPPLTPTGAGTGPCVFNTAGVTHIDPGVYYGGWNIKKKDAILELGPGVYIIAGGGITLAADASITSVQGSTGLPAPVLIYNTDNPVTHTGQAGIDFQAKETLKLAAIDTGPYKGIVLWNDGNGSNPTALIDLEGQSSLDVSGTIYSPKGNIKMEGGSSGTSTASVQIIAWQIDVGGNANLDMPYNPAKLYQFDQKGLVH
jgi:hypothetical protein